MLVVKSVKCKVTSFCEILHFRYLMNIIFYFHLKISTGICHGAEKKCLDNHPVLDSILSLRKVGLAHEYCFILWNELIFRRDCLLLSFSWCSRCLTLAILYFNSAVPLHIKPITSIGWCHSLFCLFRRPLQMRFFFGTNVLAMKVLYMNGLFRLRFLLGLQCHFYTRFCFTSVHRYWA